MAGDGPVLVTGDFNAQMGEKGPQHLLKSGFKLAVNEWVTWYCHGCIVGSHDCFSFPSLLLQLISSETQRCEHELEIV